MAVAGGTSATWPPRKNRLYVNPPFVSVFPHAGLEDRSNSLIRQSPGKPRDRRRRPLGTTRSLCVGQGPTRRIPSDRESRLISGLGIDAGGGVSRHADFRIRSDGIPGRWLGARAESIRHSDRQIANVPACSDSSLKVPIPMCPCFFPPVSRLRFQYLTG